MHTCIGQTVQLLFIVHYNKMCKGACMVTDSDNTTMFTIKTIKIL